MTKTRTSTWHPDAVERAATFDRKTWSSLSPILRRLYRFRRLKGAVLRLTARLEGGAMTSATLRHILRDYYHVDVGKYSYGSILAPGVLPPGTKIGRYCSVGSALIIRRRDHPVERPSMHPYFYNSALGLLTDDSIGLDSENPLEIANDVWIGDRVTILSGCKHIGNGAVLAAGAIVTKNVPPYAVVAGVPAKVIRQRFDADQTVMLEESRWWERDIAMLIADPPFDSLAPLPMSVNEENHTT